MVALSHGRPLVTTTGWLSEPFWSECGAVVLVAADDPRGLATVTGTLLANRVRLADLSARARTLYADRFALSHTIDALRDDVDSAPAGLR